MKGGGDFNKNNLDCLRLLLALMVVLQHNQALTEYPAFSAFGHFPAFFAVRAFFVISGLLIYRSYTRSSSVAPYFEKRFRRIYPAYSVVVVLAAFALWPLSALPFSLYFGIGFWKYLGANLVFLNFLAPSLPGVFASNPLTPVNGALWTLKIEVAFYLFVPVLYYLCRRFGTKVVVTIVFIFSCIWKYGFALLDSIARTRGMVPADGSHTVYYRMEMQFPAQLAYFTAGILMLLYFDRLRPYFPPIACLTAFLFAVDQFMLGGAIDILWISGLVFVFGFWRYFGNFSKFGDFSYGVYIVHWPILQIMIAFGLQRLPPLAFLALCLCFVAAASALMWHLVESRFLKSSSHYRQASLVNTG